MADERNQPDVMTVNVSGIEVSVDMSRLSDVDFSDAITDLIDAEESGNDVAALRAMTHFCRCVLGSQYARVKSELRAANGGTVDLPAIHGFCSEVLEEVGAKN